MLDIPTIRFELEGLKRTVVQCIGVHNDAMAASIEECVKKQLSEEWVEKEIDNQVRLLLTKTIGNISNNYRLQSTIEELICQTLENKLKESLE